MPPGRDRPAFKKEWEGPRGSDRLNPPGSRPGVPPTLSSMVEQLVSRPVLFAILRPRLKETMNLLDAILDAKGGDAVRQLGLLGMAKKFF